jgi:hypothetical protein
MSLFSWYRALTALRKKHRALRRGEYLDLYAEGDVFVFARFEGTGAKDGQVMVVALHRGTQSHKPLPLALPLWQAGVIHTCNAKTVLCTAAEGIGEVYCKSGNLHFTMPPGHFVVLEVDVASCHIE